MCSLYEISTYHFSLTHDAMLTQPFPNVIHPKFTTDFSEKNISCRYGSFQSPMGRKTLVTQRPIFHSETVIVWIDMSITISPKINNTYDECWLLLFLLCDKIQSKVAHLKLSTPPDGVSGLPQKSDTIASLMVLFLLKNPNCHYDYIRRMHSDDVLLR